MSQAASARGGPTRRSVRLSSVARSVGSQSNVTAMAPASATPGRRKGPLPQLKPRQSTAYGASGRLGAAEELAVPVTGFSHAFEEQRGAAVLRKEDGVLSDGIDGDSDQLSPTPNGHTASSSVASNEDDDPTSENEPDDEDDSGANTSKSFGMLREAGMLRNRTPPVPLSRIPAGLKSVETATERFSRRQVIGDERHVSVRPAVTIPPVTVRPAIIIPPVTVRPAITIPSVTARPAVGVPPVQGITSRLPTRPRAQEDARPHLDDSNEARSWWNTYIMGASLALVAIFLMLALPSNHGMGHAVKSRAAHHWNSMVDWVTPSPSSSPSSTPHFPEVPPGIEDLGYTRVWTAMREQHSNMIEIRKTVKTLQDELPQHIVGTIGKDGSFEIDDEFWRALLSKTGEDGANAEWDKFLKRNEAKVLQFFQRRWDMLPNKKDVILRKEFLDTMEKRWIEQSERVDKRLAELRQSVSKEASQAAAKASAHHIRLQSLALTNLVTNTELTFGKVNYFSRGTGAGIDQGLTSPTFVEKPAVIARVLRRVQSISERRPPIAALDRWDEPGDCWCSAPERSGKGIAQLGVKLAKPMRPSQITIEHIPMTMAPRKDISSAPRDVELWVESDEPATPHLAVDGDDKCGPGPAGWICLGKVQYDIRGANHVQTFHLDADSPKPVDHFMVRVTRNWGADHTCLYRMRLHGKDDAPDHDYTDRD